MNTNEKPCELDVESDYSFHVSIQNIDEETWIIL